MSTIDLSDVSPAKQRLATAYAVRNGVTLGHALLANSIDNLAQSEAYATLQELLRDDKLPEDFLVASEAGAAVQAAARATQPVK